jgi:hypothetical protein
VSAYEHRLIRAVNISFLKHTLAARDAAYGRLDGTGRALILERKICGMHKIVEMHGWEGQQGQSQWQDL